MLYLSSEEFTNQFIESVRDHRMTEFRRRFREECDVLLIDDIQFLGKKQETQNEFFYTFNALHQMSKAVVMTSDTVPSEIPGPGGAAAQPLRHGPHHRRARAELRGARGHLEEEGRRATAWTLHRQGGALHRAARGEERPRARGRADQGDGGARADRPAADRGAVRAGAARTCCPPQKALDAEHIQREVARYYKLAVDELRGERRVKHVAYARQVAMYLCRTLTQASLPEIGKKFNKDHSTVLTSVRKIERLRQGNEQLKLELGELSNKFGTV